MIDLKAVVVGNGYTKDDKIYYLCGLKRNKTTQELQWVYEPDHNNFWLNEKEAKDVAAALGAYFICEKDSAFYSESECTVLPFKHSHLGDCNGYQENQ